MLNRASTSTKALRIASRQTRRLATEAAAASSTANPTTPPPKAIPPKPKSSNQWSRPIAPGVNKAYDEALTLIRRDSNAKLREIKWIRQQLAEAPSPSLEKKLAKLEIDSEINSPEVRWNLSHGKADMAKPVYRYLMEQQWRKGGRLDLLMERIHQMHVTPDVLPSIHPTMDLQVFFDRKHWRKDGSGYIDVEPGVFMPSRMTIVQPRIQATVYHPETRLYTLLMVDPDVPDTTNQTFKTYLHMLQPNIPLSAVDSYRKDLPLSDVAAPYVAPHPAKGTPYHRYVTILLPQLDTISLKASDIAERENFDVRSFVSKYGLGYFAPEEEVSMKMAQPTYAKKVGSGRGGGIHMWRAVWDEDVSRIYQEILKLPEPVYGHPPKPDRYGGRRDNKYFSN